MRINDFEKMRQELQQMKHTLEKIPRVEPIEPVKKRKKQTIKKKINPIGVSKILRQEQIIMTTTIAVVLVTFIFSTSIFAKTIADNTVENQKVAQTSPKKSEVKQEENNEVVDLDNIVLEKNENTIPLEEILLENVSVLRSKEYAEEQREIPFEIEYHENASLPEGEEVITQEGILRKRASNSHQIL